MKQHRRDRHAGNRIRRRADLAGEPRGNCYEKESEDHNQDGAQRIEEEIQRRRKHDHRHQRDDAAQHTLHGKVAVHARRSDDALRRLPRLKSERPCFKPRQMVPPERSRLMMPPAVTAPAPI